MALFNRLVRGLYDEVNASFVNKTDKDLWELIIPGGLDERSQLGTSPRRHTDAL